MYINFDSYLVMIIITVGLPCTGKTTYTSSIDMKCIEIDEQPNSYESIDRKTIDNLLRGSYINDKLYNFLKENQEQLLIYNLFTGKCDRQTFQSNITENNKYYMGYVLSLYDSKKKFSSKTFLAYNYRNRMWSSIKTAKKELADNLAEPVCWGNTNLKPEDYEYALFLAWKKNLPIEFKVFTSTIDEICKSNVERFLETGKYVPFEKVKMLSERLNSLLRDKDESDDINEYLASKAGYCLFCKDGKFYPEPTFGLEMLFGN